MFIHASESAHSELSYKKILIKKFQKLMEKFKFYLNPVHFFILFFDFKVRLKWGKSKIQKYFSEKKSVFFADLPHNRPFPALWCKKHFQVDFSQKKFGKLDLVFNPVPPHLVCNVMSSCQDEFMSTFMKFLFFCCFLKFHLQSLHQF